MTYEIKTWSGAVLFRSEKAATVEGALQEANLSGADLSGAYLSGADLSGANLSGANLSGVDLSGANLSLAYLSGANLSRAYLSGAYLSGADLSGVDLSGANLSGADLGEQWIIQGATRSDGHAFMLQKLTGDKEPIVRAGCRRFTLAQAQKHWQETRKGTPLFTETEIIIRSMVALAVARKLMVDPAAVGMQVNSVINDLDALVALAVNPETASLIEQEKVAIGQIVVRAQLVGAFLLAAGKSMRAPA